MSFLLRMQDSTLTSLSNLVCPNVHCQRVFFRIRTQMARHVKAFRVDDWDIGWRIYIYIYIYTGWYHEHDFFLAFVSRVRPLGQFAARAWQAWGCWKSTAACAQQRGSSCEWTCSKFHHIKLHLLECFSDQWNVRKSSKMSDSCAPTSYWWNMKYSR